jgi:release factor glutamine methyltransferase
VTTLQALVHEATDQLTDSSASPRLDAELLLSHVFHKDRAWILAHADEKVASINLKLCKQLIKRRLAGEPLAYIVGQKEFFGRSFTTNKRVLVPRPESEAFILLLNDLMKRTALNTCCDIGTGSGILAITAKLEHPQLTVTATDNDAKALQVAAQNARKLQAQITLKKQDLLENDNQNYDLIMANLPYVPLAMRDRSIQKEPGSALFSGSDGLDHYRALFDMLRSPKFVMTESLTSQHTQITQYAQEAGYLLVETNGLIQLFAK